jgi:hypothetical protein
LVIKPVGFGVDVVVLVGVLNGIGSVAEGLDNTTLAVGVLPHAIVRKNRMEIRMNLRITWILLYSSLLKRFFSRLASRLD